MSYRDESIHVNGKVKSISDPFKMDQTSNQHVITIETDKGLFSIPVSYIHKYGVNQNVEIFVTVRTERLEK